MMLNYWLNIESWNSTVDRLYYACFYAVNALLIHHGFEPKSHNGVKTIFFKEFIASEKIPKEYGYLYSDLMDWRSQSDYADFIDLDAETVLPLISKAGEFINILQCEIG